MKTRSLVATVAGLHVVVIGGALLISGCRSLPPSMEKKDKKASKEPLAPTAIASNPDPLLPPLPPALPPPLPPISEKPVITESTYKVQKGDTLSKIAKHEGVSLTAMLDANKMTTKSVIHPGQVIVIPNHGTAHGTSAAVKTTAASSEAYVVKKGDTLAKIAKTNGTSVTAIKEANHLNGDVIQVGQKLKVPTVSETSTPKHHAAKLVEPKATATVATTPAPPATADSGKYTVAKGDSPATIAKKLGVKTDALMAANHLTPEKAKSLQVGQTLVVPGKGAPAAPTSTALPPAPVPPTDTATATGGTTAPPPSPVTTEAATPIAAPVAPPVPGQP